MLHELRSALDDDKASDNSSLAADKTSEDEENESTLLVNSATWKDASPADIRKLLSTPSKKKLPNKTPDEKKISINESKHKKKVV